MQKILLIKYFYTISQAQVQMNFHSLFFMCLLCAVITQIQANSCQVQGCSECDEPSECTSCDTDARYILSGTTCCSTNDEQYPDNSGGCNACALVIPGCTSCQVSETVTQCTQCDTTKFYHLSGVSCCHTTTAEDAQFPDGNGGCEICGEANYGCDTCHYNEENQMTQCAFCSEGFLPSGSICCNETFSVSDGAGGCSGCPEGCSTCGYDGGKFSCTECSIEQGYQPSGTGCCNTNQPQLVHPDNEGGCKLCDDVIEGCFACGLNEATLRTYCAACQEWFGYYISGQTCCNPSQNHYPDGSGGCLTCAQIIPGCLNCQYNQVAGQPSCLQCNPDEGFQLISTTIIDENNVVYGCKNCTEGVGCVTCRYDGVQNICMSCESGFALSGDVCCDVDGQGLYPDGEGGCKTCSNTVVGCVQCSIIDGVTGCDQCDTGYTISGRVCCDDAAGREPDGNGACTGCSTGCNACIDNSGTEECTTCDTANGYYKAGTTCCNTNADSFPNNQQCDGCSDIFTGCTSCAMNSGAVECQACDEAQNYFLSGGECCDGGSQSFPDGSGSCSACGTQVTGCASCSYDSSTSSLTCTACTEADHEPSGANCCDTGAGSFPDNAQSCDVCSSVIDGCQTCQVTGGVTGCSACQSGYQISGSVCCHTASNSVPDGNGGCTQCPSSCQACTDNAGTMECTTCDTQNGFYLSGTTCCDTNNDAFPDTKNGCDSCSAVIGGCETCKVTGGDTVCSICGTGYEKSGSVCCHTASNSFPDENGTCTGCPTGCQACNDNAGIMECTTCDTANGYYKAGTTCCNTNADSFPNNQQCDGCSDIFTGCTSCAMNSGAVECQACDEAQNYFLSGGECCDGGSQSFPDGSGSCSACGTQVTGCASCSYDSSTSSLTCTACTEADHEPSGANCCDTGAGSFPDNAQSCDVCSSVIDGCQTCQVTGGVTGCSACQSGYQISGSVCCHTASNSVPDGNGGCTQCPSSCQACTDNAGTMECTTCDTQNGFYLSGTTCCDTNNDAFPDTKNGCDSCSAVIGGCETCKVTGGDTVCSICGTGYEKSGSVCCHTASNSFPDENGTCTGCPTGCQACNDNAGIMECTTCDTANGYYKAGTTCCNTNADSFPNNQQCDGCSDIFTGCTSCAMNSGAVECQACDEAQNYFLSGGECCDGGSQSFPDGSGSCSACGTQVTGCASCSYDSSTSSLTCTACTEADHEPSGANCCDTGAGSFPDNAQSCDVCSSVIDGCQTCQVTGGVTGCSACQSGYQISGSVCCHTASNSVPDGNGGCTQCPSSCQACTDNAGTMECTTCDTQNGFYLSGTTCCDTNNDAFPDTKNGCDSCSAVIGGCETCKVTGGDTVCSICGTGYEKSGSVCCHTASNSFPDENGTCTGCPTGCQACNDNAGIMECTTCDTANGYYKAGTTCCNTNADSFPNNQQCDGCSDIFTGCTSCAMNSGAVECQACDEAQNYFLSGGECCDGGSQSFPDGSGSCSACGTQVTGCASCSYDSSTSSLTCTACTEADHEPSGANCCDTGAGSFPDNAQSCDVCSSVIDGCQTCQVTGGVTGCSACQSGYQISGSVCCHTASNSVPDGNGGCTQCPSSCQACTDNAGTMECTTCDTQNGFYLSGTTCCDTNNDAFPDTKNGCDSCSAVIGGCETCKVTGGDTVCSICGTGYEKSGSVCCHTASNSFPDENGTCTGCPTGCQACNDNAGIMECTTCDTANGYYKAGTTCCNTNADSFPNNQQCDGCSDIFTGCTSCAMNSGAVECQACDEAQNYFLSGGECCDGGSQSFPDGSGSCSACGTQVTGCASCSYDSSTSSLTCTACTEADHEPSGANCCDTGAGSFPDNAQSCDVCSSVIDGCQTCQVTGGVTGCSACQSGYQISGSVCCHTASNSVPDGNGGCTQCPSSCQACTDNAGTMECTTCDTQNGFYLSGTTCCDTNNDAFPDTKNGCDSCSAVIGGCETCKVTGGDTVCSICGTGYEKSGSVCCHTASNSFPDENGTCTGCPTGCQACNDNAGIMECTTCDTANGYYKAGTTCCNTNADSFPNNQQCDGCSDIFTGCTSCAMNSGAVECQACDEAQNYFLSGGECCDGGSQSFPDGSGSCSACGTQVTGCASCSYDSSTSSLTCTACTEADHEPSGANCCDTGAGSFPDNAQSCDVCSSVIDGCQTCQVTGGVTGCSACQSGYQISGSVCCHTASNSVPDGNGGCTQCPSSCQACTDNAGTMECTTCDTQNGFYLSGTTCCDTNNDAFPDTKNGCDSCSAVIGGCETCKVTGGDTVCSICGTGYEKSGSVCCHTASNSFPDENGTCTGCPTGCQACNDNAGIMECTTCDTANGYYKAGTTCCNTNADSFPNNQQCDGCSDIFTGCTSCAMNSGAVECQACDEAQNYFLSGGECCDGGSQSFPDGSGSCSACGTQVTGCASCSYDSSTSSLTCTACTEADHEPSGANCCDTGAGSFPDNAQSCDVCSSVIDGCQTCQVTGGVTGCSACQSGYQISGSVCCHTASNSVPDGNGGCTQCPSSCQACTDNAGTMECTTCDTQNGFYLSGTTCCDTNNDAFPDTKNGCDSCSAVIGGCETCKVTGGDTVCSICGTGYEKSGSVCCHTASNSFPDENGTCTGCPTGCQACNDNAGIMECTTCDTANGYYKAGTTCCNTNADSFPNNQQCDGCSDIFTGCTSCAMNSGAVECQACDEAQNYFLSGGECCDGGSQSFPDGSGSCSACGTQVTGCASCSYDSSTSSLTCTACTEADHEPSGANCCDTGAGSFPDNAQSCDVCSSVIDGCQTCQVTGGVTGCSACQSGYQISGSVCCHTASNSQPDGSGGCKNCPNGCETCIDNAGTMECTSCDTDNGFILSGTSCCDTNNEEYPDNVNSCSSCSTLIPGCLTCTYVKGFPLVCDGCDSGQDYFSDGNGGCQACSVFIPGCSSCVLEEGNVNCDQCSSIIDNCEKCSDVSTCLSCATGFYVDGGSCTSCSTSLPDATTCTTCPQAYAIVNGQCQLCGHHEVKVITGDACMPCSDIHPQCQICSDQNTCTFCGFGYQVKADGSGCFHCVDIDTECVACSSDSICTECLHDYILTEGTCEPISGGTSAIFDHDGQKGDCNVGCGSCSDATSCDTCAPGFVDFFANCLVCDETCVTCQAPATCLSCYKGNYLDGASCVACSQNCLTCTASECQICSDGFGPDGAGCSKCGDFCSKCISPTECTKCDIGFTSDNGVCISCMIGCSTCEPEQIETCTECGDGYYLKDGACNLCGENCYICDDESSCRVCETGYNLIADTFCAQACQYPCDLCEGSPTLCNTCFAGYTHDGQTSCTMDTTCNSTSNCDICPRRYYLSSQNRCENCQSNCDFCSSVNTCTKCSPGYLLSSGSCAICPAECKTCTSEYYCSSCKAGYFEELDDGCIKTGKCKPCQTTRHCKECRGTASQCTVCEDGYKFLGIICVLEWRIAFDLELQMKLPNFRSQVNAFKIRFMHAINHPEYTDPHLFHIMSLTSGSTKINAQLEVLSTSASDIYEKILSMTDSNAIHEDFLMKALENETTIGWTYENPDPDFPWYAIVLPLCLLIAIVVVLIKLCRKKVNSSDLEKDHSTPDLKPFTQTYPMPVKQNHGKDQSIPDLKPSQERLPIPLNKYV